MTTPIERMKKILALARRGEGGERTTAEAMLQRLLAKYGMTIADLDDAAQPTARHEFKYSTAFEKRLLVQIVANVLGTKDFAVWYRGGSRAKTRGFDLTALQHAEVDVRYTAFRKALAKEMKKASERTYSAFVHANDLGLAPSDEESDTSDVDLDEVAAIMAIMQTMRPTPVHRQLEAAA